jgi:hypothetical protein
VPDATIRVRIETPSGIVRKRQKDLNEMHGAE